MQGRHIVCTEYGDSALNTKTDAADSWAGRPSAQATIGNKRSVTVIHCEGLLNCVPHVGKRRYRWVGSIDLAGTILRSKHEHHLVGLSPHARHYKASKLVFPVPHIVEATTECGELRRLSAPRRMGNISQL